MKKLFTLLATFAAVAVMAVACGAAVVLPAVAPEAAPATIPAITATPAPSLIGWFKLNLAVILGAALGLSELLACIPAFRGNGIIDTLIKGLKALSQKQDA